MEDSKNTTVDAESLKQLQRALFYESQFRNAIVADAVSFFDANITMDVIESDFFFRNSDNGFISVPEYLGITPPCKFSEFLKAWFDIMVPNLNQKVLRDVSVLRETLLEVYSQGKREYVLNYWAEDINGKKIFYNHRFLLTCNEFGNVFALSIIKDSTKLHELDAEGIQSELEQYAFFDPITNGYNYIKFKSELVEQNVPGFIVSLDIHSFKIINSICGISKGDEVIKHIWECILTVIDIENKDLAAHINADHYVIFVPGEKEEDLIGTLKALSLSLLIISVDLDVPEIHPYYGISRWTPEKKIEMAYSEAITAKHNAKYLENMNYAFFNEEDTLRLIHEKKVIDSFETALAKKEFEIWFQPKFSPKNKKLVGAEALVRWRTEDGKLMKPDDFIPIFERNNMIRALDEYIFRNVCHQQKRWQLEGKKIVPISVNLSRASLYYKGIAEQYQRIAEISEIRTEYVPIEITESATVANDKVKEVIENFHKCGFSIHMDDFGSGYSSLASLNLMHFDTIKLDKSLVDFIGQFGGNRLIEHTILLAKEMGIMITAEGVENEAQVKFLKNIGCDSIQGYFYSKPVPGDKFVEFLDGVGAVPLSTKIDQVEDHIYTFNQNYYKPALYSYVIDLTKDEVTDYSEHLDWGQKTDVNLKCFSETIAAIKNDQIADECKDIFEKFMNRENMLNSFAGIEETAIGEFKRVLSGKVSRVRVVRNLFRVDGSEDVWLYLKVYELG